MNAMNYSLSSDSRRGSVFFDQIYDRQCFLWRANWNEGLDGFQHRCPGRTPVATPGVERPGLAYLP